MPPSLKSQKEPSRTYTHCSSCEYAYCHCHLQAPGGTAENLYRSPRVGTNDSWRVRAISEAGKGFWTP